jgi:hypothetical protein
VASISTLPSNGSVSINLSAGTATVKVIAGQQTTATFVDAVPTTGFVEVCKVAGAGIAVGTNFTFNFGGATFTVPAGAAPGGTCSPPLLAPVGPVVITETIPAAGAQDGPYQIGYAANLNIGDSVVNISNDGANGGFHGAGTSGNICVNVYAFDPQEEETGCCACLVTPNGLNSLSVQSDLISNPLTPAIPTSLVIKLVASTPGIDQTGNYTICNPAGKVLMPANTVAPEKPPLRNGTLTGP